MILKVIRDPIVYFDFDELTKGKQKRIYVFTCLPLNNDDRTVRVRCPEDKMEGYPYTGLTIKVSGVFIGEILAASKVELWEVEI